MNLSIESVEARAGRDASGVDSTWLKRSLRKPSNLGLWRINGSGRKILLADSNPVERFLLAKKQS